VTGLPGVRGAYGRAMATHTAQMPVIAGPLPGRPTGRAQAIAWRALRLWGRHAPAREQLAAAVAVLRDDPDTDTVRALVELASLEVSAGSPAADALSAEALVLGQNLVVDEATLAGLFETRGLQLNFAGLSPQAAAYYRESARLAERAGDPVRLGRSLYNLSDAVTGTDPDAGAEAGRAAAAQLRRAGARNQLATAVENLAQALLMTGDWDGADAELSQAADADGLAGIEHLACYQAWLAAMRGDAPAAQAIPAGRGDLRATEDPQDQALIAVAEAFTATAGRQPAAALRWARAALGHAGALNISHESLRWAWPLAARAAHDLAHTTTTRELLALLDGYQPGQLAPMQRAERDLTRARLAAAITGLRQHSTPYHLAHGLLDHAAQLSHLGDDQAAAAAVGEAADIAQQLGCQPLLERAETARSARPRTAAS